jgi:PPM family protein phosphatase
MNCQQCGAPADRIDSDFDCADCGFRQIGSQDRNSIALQPAPNLAGASDRGHRHHHNEDAIAIRSIDPDTAIIVVCDGISNSQRPELASQQAAAACVREIDSALSIVDADAAIRRGIDAALAAVTQIPIDPTCNVDPSSTTIVAAIVRNRVATIAWLGDSRAYWLAHDRSLQLTQDHSWLHEAVASGMYTQAEAEASPYAHSIVCWLGADDTAGCEPPIVTFELPGSGYLLLCTDGLWNYAPDPSYLHHLLCQSTDRDSLAIVRHLVRYANNCGGRDNITVGLFAVSG